MNSNINFDINSDKNNKHFLELPKNASGLELRHEGA